MTVKRTIILKLNFNILKLYCNYMKIKYIMLLNISENFEGNVNFENSIRGYLMTRYIFKRLGYMFYRFSLLLQLHFS